MTNLSATTYQGFSNVSGYLTLEEFFNRIGSPAYERVIRKINRLVQEGNLREAANVKRQLPFFTLTANYNGRRLPSGLTGYNDLITIDIDGLTDEQVASLRPRIEQDPATVGCFLTAKQHGYKILAYLVTPEMEKLRGEYLQTTELTYECLEEYHAKAYETTRLHYERLLGVAVDASGKDISRGVFASHDPHVFYSPERAARVKLPQAKILPGEPDVKRKGRKAQAGKPDSPAPLAKPGLEGIDPVTLIEFNKCVAAVRRTIRYEEGSHNTFLFTLGNKCFARGLGEEDVKRLAAHRFGEGGKWNTGEPIANGYTYTDKTEKAAGKKEDRLPVIEQVKTFLDGHYRFRRNILLDRLEIQELPTPQAATDVPAEAKGPRTNHFRPMGAQDLNTLFLKLQEAGISYALNNLRAVVDSDYARPFDPFAGYFDNLPAWDGQTDHIGLLAETVQTTDQPYWRQVFRRWITAMVDCARGTSGVNQQVLLLCGRQGKGKSTWIRNLLPPELREYYRNGMIEPGSRDDMLLLSTRILINMEEFEGVRPADIPGLKRLISQESVTLRKPYDIQSRTYPRRASFIGSTNNARFLSDMSGSRRFLVVQAKEIDYRREIDHRGLYSQVNHLIAGGFQHWFEGEEIDRINDRNEQHRMKDPVEENLYVYFQPAAPQEHGVKWKPAAAILSYLSAAGRTQANVQTQQLLVQVLERDGFAKRTNANGITEYGVRTLTMEEIEKNSGEVRDETT